MAIPDLQNVMRPVLVTVQNGAPLPLNDVREWPQRCRKFFDLRTAIKAS